MLDGYSINSPKTVHSLAKEKRVPSNQNSIITQVRNVCISPEKHKLCIQDIHGWFLRIVNIPSDMFNSHVHFQVLLLQITRNSRKYVTRKCSQNVPETFWKAWVMSQEWHESRLRFCLQGMYKKQKTNENKSTSQNV